LTVNTIYQLYKSPGNIPYSLYEQMMTTRSYRANFRIAIPLAVGDSYKGQRIIATLPKLFGFDEEGKPLDAERIIEYRPDKKYEIEFGKVFAPNKFEAVSGADVPKLTGLNLGATFHATHGMPQKGESEDIHEEQWTVTGVLKRTHTAADRVIYIPLTTFYCIFEHEEALGAMAKLRGDAPATAPAQVTTPAPSTQPLSAEDALFAGGDHKPRQYVLNPDGTIDLKLPKEQWLLSAIMVKSRSGFNAQSLMWDINNQNVAGAVNPATVMRQFFDVFLDPSARLLQAISYLVTIVAGVGILVSIYNSVSARMKEIAILRALGATRTKILTLICLEAGMIGVIGSILGLFVGHLLGAVGSQFTEKMVGEGINWMHVGREEWLY
jgi:putative ABC transport system permease protein